MATSVKYPPVDPDLELLFDDLNLLPILLSFFRGCIESLIMPLMCTLATIVVHFKPTDWDFEAVENSFTFTKRLGSPHAATAIFELQPAPEMLKYTLDRNGGFTGLAATNATEELTAMKGGYDHYPSRWYQKHLPWRYEYNRVAGTLSAQLLPSKDVLHALASKGIVCLREEVERDGDDLQVIYTDIAQAPPVFPFVTKCSTREPTTFTFHFD